MTPSAQITIAIIAIGLYIGGVAAIIAKGRGLLVFLICGPIGAFVGALLLPRLLEHRAVDPLVPTLIFAPVGAIIFVVAARLILRPK
jgi:uncharacterized membrane protein YeaQ/YmgE (transglycosylase-associated protein family)